MRKPSWETLLSWGVRATLPFRPAENQHPILALNEYVLRLARSTSAWVSMTLPGQEGLFVMPPEVSGPLSMFAQQRDQKIFKISSEFGKHLAKVDLDIHTRHLRPTDGFVFIEYPENIRYELSYTDGYELYAHSALVFCCIQEGGTGAKDFFIHRTGKELAAYLHILTPLYDAEGNLTHQFDSLRVAVAKEHHNVGMAIRAAYFNHIGSQSMGKAKAGSKALEHYSYLAKCLVYVGSGDPDLREYRAPRAPLTEKNKKLRRWVKEHENKSLVDMTLVGYDFKKPRMYQVGEVQVTGHFRWQPYGPKTDPKVKLIWIEPYVKNYKQEEEP